VEDPPKRADPILRDEVIVLGGESASDKPMIAALHRDRWQMEQVILGKAKKDVALKIQRVLT
jgi:hypothetical protein